MIRFADGHRIKVIDADVGDRSTFIAHGMVVVGQVRVEANRSAVECDLTEFSHFCEIGERLVYRPQRYSWHLSGGRRVQCLRSRMLSVFV